jgi:vanillin dehydrogenase
MSQYGSYINGEWKNSKASFDIHSPVTNDIYATIWDASTDDVSYAIESAQAAFPLWANLSPNERAEYLLKVADALETLQAEMEEALIMEVGSWIGKAKFESSSAPQMFRAAAELALKVEGYDLVSPMGKQSKVIREPLGVTSVITPWNVPLNLSSATTSGILALGNTVVLKPSELSPLSGGYFLAKAFSIAGVPAGVFNVVTCSKKHVNEVGDIMITHPYVKAISFTGSTQVGKMIAGKAGALLKKVSMELGGKDAMIIMEDADIHAAVDAATFSSFNHAGQICMGTKRIYVDNKIKDNFLSRFVANTQALGYGDVRDFSKPIPPLINEVQAKKIEAQIDDAVSKGASVLAGGKREGLFVQPTILSDVTEDMETFDEESFGPLVSVYGYDNVDNAIEQVNASKYGLSGSVLTSNKDLGYQVASKMESGMCHVNDGTIYAEMHAPFGGVKNSGIGRYRGLASIESFTQTRWITIQEGEKKFPPPFSESRLK